MDCIIRKHRWKTVAIDTGHEWFYAKDPDKSFDHIVLFQVCINCGKRHMDYEDPSVEGKSYAIKGHSGIAKVRSHWLNGGELKPSDKIEYLDTSFAPDSGVEQLINKIKKDKVFGPLIKDHKMVDDALGQLEVAVKLCLDNPKDP